MPEEMLKWWIRWCRACFFCGTSYGETDFVCRECEGALRARAFAQELDVLEFPLKAGFLWSENDRVLAELIYALKGGTQEDAFFFLAGAFSRQHLFSVSSGGKSDRRVFIPAPAKIHGGKDHAFLWAESLARHYQGEVRQVFRRMEERAQKELSAEERAEKKLAMIGAVAPDEKLIFCDDVVTSGSTAKAAFKALQCPSGFEAWSIAYRPKRHLNFEDRLLSCRT